jgi:hypothetical protein
MIATWSAKLVWVVTAWEISSTSKPFLLASSAEAWKKSVAVLKTPVMSGGVQPMTTDFSLHLALAASAGVRFSGRLRLQAVKIGTRGRPEDKYKIVFRTFYSSISRVG